MLLLPFEVVMPASQKCDIQWRRVRGMKLFSCLNHARHCQVNPSTTQRVYYLHTPILLHRSATDQEKCFCNTNNPPFGSPQATVGWHQMANNRTLAQYSLTPTSRPTFSNRTPSFACIELVLARCANTHVLPIGMVPARSRA